MWSTVMLTGLFPLSEFLELDKMIYNLKCFLELNLELAHFVPHNLNSTGPSHTASGISIRLWVKDSLFMSIVRSEKHFQVHFFVSNQQR